MRWKWQNLYFLLILFCTPLYAFEPPIDILNIDYNTYSQGEEGIISDGNIAFSEKVDYFGSTINYNVYFDKQDKEKKYVFFFRPNSNQDAFFEFYKDILSYYTQQALMINPRINNKSANEIEITYEYLIPNYKKMLIYAKRANIQGFRGFGISVDYESEIIENNAFKYLDAITNFYRPILKSLSGFAANTFDINHIYIAENAAFDSFDDDISYTQSENTAYFGNRWLFRFTPFTNFTIEIDSKDASGISWLLLSTSNGKNYVIDKFPWRLETIAWNELIIVDLKGKFKEEAEEVVFSLRVKAK